MKTDSSNLTGKLLQATTPEEIATMMTDIETHLRSHSVDQNRYFFSSSFPTLLIRVFGFENFVESYGGEKHPSWFDCASFDPDLTRKIFYFLSPSGTLFSSILAVDRLSVVKYGFPVGCLPDWFYPALSRVPDSRIFDHMCPLFKGRVKGTEFKFQFHLNIFEYFFFCFAYFAFIRGNCGNFGTEKNYPELSKWTSSWNTNILILLQQYDHGLYLCLFDEYLYSFAPITHLNVHERFPSDDPVAMRAEFVVNVFVHYWLLKADVSPLSVNECKSVGVSFPLKPHLMGMPPPLGLGEMFKLLIKHLNLSLVLIISRHKKLNFVISLEIASWNAIIQRSLYRFRSQVLSHSCSTSRANAVKGYTHINFFKRVDGPHKEC